MAKVNDGTTAEVANFPDCDFCKVLGYQPVRAAKYDFRSYDGRWGFGCTSHWREYRASNKLGTGIGQKLVLAGV